MTAPGSARLLRIGGVDKAGLLARLKAQQVALNEHAQTLFASDLFVVAEIARDIRVCEVSVAELGLPAGGTWQALIDAAAVRGLKPCPMETATHLRLVLTDQREDASDALTGAGRAPAGALTVISPPLLQDADFPRGFYLRRLDGVDWLRGYRSDDAHVWLPEAVTVWQVAESA
jgi:hypothetical protein